MQVKKKTISQAKKRNSDKTHPDETLKREQKLEFGI